MKNLWAKLFSLLLMGGFALVLGCSPSERAIEKSRRVKAWMACDHQIKVLSTTSIVADIVDQVGGERISHVAMITGPLDPHSYEIVKGDMEKLTFADVIFCNGLGLEHGASMHQYLSDSDRAVHLGNLVREKSPERFLEVDGELDPHIWMDVSLWKEVIDPIAEKLSALDPDGRDYFLARAKVAKERLEALDQEVQEVLSKVPESNRYLVTSHDAFNYFAKRYLSDETDWKEHVMAPEGIAPDGNISGWDLKHIIDHICHYQVKVVFSESNVSRDSLNKILHSCCQQGMELCFAEDSLYGDALGDEGSAEGTYEGMIRHNAEVIASYLRRE
ncbi:MAG: Manganese-binding lipoprotein MntA [Chlamydiia bacterium]|nr:Manganese-binding lipoprotein MntA [Chlamydiia bacterium]